MALYSETKAAEEGPAPGAIAVQGDMVHAGVLTQQLTHEAEAQALELRCDEQQPKVRNSPIGSNLPFDDGEAIWAPFYGGPTSGNSIYDIVLNQAANA